MRTLKNVQEQLRSNVSQSIINLNQCVFIKGGRKKINKAISKTGIWPIVDK